MRVHGGTAKPLCCRDFSAGVRVVTRYLDFSWTEVPKEKALHEVTTTYRDDGSVVKREQRLLTPRETVSTDPRAQDIMREERARLGAKKRSPGGSRKAGH